MNHEAVSQIFFQESHDVSADQTAQNLFRLLAEGSAYADRLVDAMATGYLLALLESLCLREMHRYLDDEEEIVVGRSARWSSRPESSGV